MTGGTTARTTGGAARTRVGFAYRKEYRDALRDGAAGPAVLELMAEAFDPRLPGRVQQLAELRGRHAIVGHSVGLSIGSVERPPTAYFDGVARFLELAQPAYHSDHFAVTYADGRDLGHLTPIWYGEQALETVVRNLEAARRLLGVPLCLEIIAEPFELPGAQWDQARFAAEVHRATGCGIHLDVTNVYINARNFGYDPRACIAALPAGAVKLMHVVGFGRYEDGELADTHDQDIQEELFELVAYALTRVRPDHVIIERDGNFPPYAALLAEVARLEALVAAAEEAHP